MATGPYSMPTQHPHSARVETRRPANTGQSVSAQCILLPCFNPASNHGLAVVLVGVVGVVLVAAASPCLPSCPAASARLAALPLPALLVFFP
ncbi:hypothetical protein CDD82_3318 [Ophiocordyceps australis]|uniref:Uncharacterized protein n=1 Tax=Ophiocordyceps australis TaxID=1399860 RepID=A0A2C5ZEN1_9HYPO|nr:hypothetical protein CDD82_3318 [Ophiocordyceps australis]